MKTSNNRPPSVNAPVEMISLRSTPAVGGCPCASRSAALSQMSRRAAAPAETFFVKSTRRSSWRGLFSGHNPAGRSPPMTLPPQEGVICHGIAQTGYRPVADAAPSSARSPFNGVTWKVGLRVPEGCWISRHQCNLFKRNLRRNTGKRARVSLSPLT